MKGKAVFTLAIIGALFSLGYSGCEASCDYKSATYKSSAGTIWTVNVHVKQSTNQACIEYSYIQHSCSQDSGGCSYPFHGLSICFDEKYRLPCVGQNSNNYYIVSFDNCSSRIGCTMEDNEQQQAGFSEFEYMHRDHYHPKPRY